MQDNKHTDTQPHSTQRGHTHAHIHTPTHTHTHSHTHTHTHTTHSTHLSSTQIIEPKKQLEITYAI